MLKKFSVCLVPVLGFAACIKCKEPGDVCTEEFRTITLKVVSVANAPVALDSVYTVRPSTDERITHRQPATPGLYVVLDDSYHQKLREAEDDFRFVGWRNNRIAVDQIFRIAAGNCHIQGRSGASSVTVP